MEYSAKFRDKMIAKMTGPDARSATSLSKEVGIAQATLSRWLRAAMVGPMTKRKKDGGRRRWRAEEKVRVVMEAAAVGEDELGAFLRREGLHEADLERFREEVREAATQGLRPKRRRGLSPEQKQIRALQKELARKEKALAETAALLVLRKKAEAFFWAGEEGDTTGSSDE